MTVLIFKVDRHSVKVPFHDRMRLAVKLATVRPKLDAFNAHTIRSLADQ